MSTVEYEGGAVSLVQIQKAASRLKGHATVTPILRCSTLDELAGAELFFKAEIFQKTGSFKFRGAFNAISRCLEETTPPLPTTTERRVVTHSSGNHAAAVALAASMMDTPSLIIVPNTIPAVKRAALSSYDLCAKSRVVECEPTMEARERCCNDAIHSDLNYTFIPPYNHPDVICGQGTIALELLEQVEGLDAIVVPVSGGGMISGVAVAAKSLRPDIKIIAAEPCGCDRKEADVAASKAAGALVEGMPKPDTICDGLQARMGSITWPIIRDLVDSVEVVTEEEVVNAMRLCFERMKVVVEPSGAVGLATALAMRRKSSGHVGVKRIGVILCGGNVDFEGKVPGFWSKWLPAAATAEQGGAEEDAC